MSAECNQRGFSGVVLRFIIGMSMRSKGGVMHPDGNLRANERIIADVNLPRGYYNRFQDPSSFRCAINGWRWQGRRD